MKSNKAQTISFDLLIAVFIFSIILVLIMIKLNYYNETLFEKAEYRDMMLRAFEISEALVKTSGKPTGWDSTNVVFLGLASDDRKISKEKAEEFCNISETRIRSMLDLSYYFYFNLNGTITCGSIPAGKKIVSVKRNVFFEGKNAILEFTLWR
jgi:hypothetical protein